MIQVTNLTKTFQTLNRQPGFIGGIKNLFSNDYRTIEAVSDISFVIDQGEVVGYIGPNGAGKSTTIKMLTGILHPTAGEVRVDGFVPQQERVRNSMQIGVVFGQRSQLHWDIPPRDSFDLMRKMYTIQREQYQRNLNSFTELLEMGDLLDRPVRQLSLGQRMRCELVASLLHNPKILYLDEPTIGLDVVAKERIREFIQSVNRERQTTVILTTHDIADIERLCRRVMIIDKGKLIYDGTLAEIKRRFGRRRQLTFSLVEGATADGMTAALQAVGTGITIQTNDDDAIVVGFDPQLVDATTLTRHIVNSYPVTDLAVAEADLEAIIRAIYHRGHTNDE